MMPIPTYRNQTTAPAAKTQAITDIKVPPNSAPTPQFPQDIPPTALGAGE